MHPVGSDPHTDTSLPSSERVGTGCDWLLCPSLATPHCTRAASSIKLKSQVMTNAGKPMLFQNQ